MAMVFTTIDRCKWVADRLKLAQSSGDLRTELALQIRLDQLLDQLHAETLRKDA